MMNAKWIYGVKNIVPKRKVNNVIDNSKRKQDMVYLTKSDFTTFARRFKLGNWRNAVETICGPRASKEVINLYSDGVESIGFRKREIRRAADIG